MDGGSKRISVCDNCDGDEAGDVGDDPTYLVVMVMSCRQSVMIATTILF